MPNANGRFVWHELSTTDPDGAQRFYTEIISWGTQPWEDNEDYTLWTNEGAPLGGVTMLKSEFSSSGSQPQWTPYICVYDVDDCTRQVRQLGGSIVKGPVETPNVGCWAVVKDPQGAPIGLFEPAGPAPGHLGTPHRGEFSWHELVTSDYKAAFDFYRALFKWEKTGEFDMGQMGTYFMFGQRGQTYGGIFNRVPEMPPPSWLSYICVSDVDATADTVKQAGGKVILGPMEVPGGDRILQGVDPQGAWFALHAVASR